MSLKVLIYFVRCVSSTMLHLLTIIDNSLLTFHDVFIINIRYGPCITHVFLCTQLVIIVVNRKRCLVVVTRFTRGTSKRWNSFRKESNRYDMCFNLTRVRKISREVETVGHRVWTWTGVGPHCPPVVPFPGEGTAMGPCEPTVEVF